jgi:hypothetical protein
MSSALLHASEGRVVVNASVLMKMAGAVAVLTVMSTAIATQAEARSADRTGERRCTNASLRGTFGFTAQGVTLAGSPVPAALQGAFASSGVSTFDGRGHFTLTATSSFNGIIQGPATVEGTYDVNDDCTYTSVADNGATFRAVIVGGGDELLILQTTPGVVISGSAQRRGRSRETLSNLLASIPSCGAAAIRGTYGFLAAGEAGPPTIPAELAGRLMGVGTVAFDKDGTFTLVATRSVNGTLDPEPLTLTGTYTFTSRCSFRMAFDVGFTFNGTIVEGGKELLFIETDPGTTLTVRAKRR